MKNRSLLFAVMMCLPVQVFAHGGPPEGPVEIKIQFSPNENPENLAFDSRTGDLWVTLLAPGGVNLSPMGELLPPGGELDPENLPVGEVRRYNKHFQHVRTYQLPPGTKLVTGIVVNGVTGKVYVGHASWLLGESGILELDPCSGAWTQHSMLPGWAQAGLLNGLEADSDGNLYATDSALGYVWKAPAGGGLPLEVWVDLGAPGAPPSGFLPPGPNGNKFGPDGDMYVAISIQARIVRVPMNSDGSAGTPETFIQIPPGADPAWPMGLTPDDFAFDSRGKLYLATEPMSGVTVINADGTVGAEVMSFTAGLANTTATAFQRTPGDRNLLCVGSGAFPFFQPPWIPVMPLPAIACKELARNVRGFPIAEWRDASCRRGRDCRQSCDEGCGH